MGTARVLCPAHRAATCAACAATGRGIKYCCSLGHEGHRLAPAAQRAGPGRFLRGFKRPGRCTGLRPPHARCWACAACAATGQGIKYCCSLGHEGHRLAPAAQRAGPGRCVRGFKRPGRCTGLRPPHARCWACAACAATGQGIKYCCSLGHEGHRLAPAAQRAGARVLCLQVASSALAGAPAYAPLHAWCWAPEGGSRRGAHQRMSHRRRGSVCCLRQCWGGGVGRHESALPPPTTSHRAGGPLLGLGHLFPTLPGTPAPTTHGDMGGEGRAAGGWVSHSPSHGRTASVALASCLLGSVVVGTPAGCVVGHDIAAPPTSTHGRSRGGGGGQGRGRTSLSDVFGSISAALIDAARADGTEGDPPPPRDREH